MPQINSQGYRCRAISVTSVGICSAAQASNMTPPEAEWLEDAPWAAGPLGDLSQFQHAVAKPMKNETSLYLDLVRFSAALMVFLEHIREHTLGNFWPFWSAHPFWNS